MKWILFLLTPLVSVAPLAVAAEVRRPVDDAEVLQRLPRVLFMANDRLAAWREQLAADPENLAAAVGLATDSMEIAQREDDPRFLGHAIAALQPWWTLESPPVEVLRLRAKLRERDHDYAGALADQQRILDGSPDDLQARVESANLWYVTGDYGAARAAIASLEASDSRPAATVARLPLDVATGHAERALQDADRLLADPATSPELRGFADIIGADAARALGRSAEAEARFRAGLDRAPGDAYLLRAYADFLLDRGRPAEVLPLASERAGDNGLLLRLAIAAKRTGRADLAATATRQLSDRFEEIRLRGGLPHGRFESRYELELADDPAAALRIALANWSQQKQARDARNVLEAALAAEQPAAADDVVRFLRDANTEDADLTPLLDQLEAAR